MRYIVPNDDKVRTIPLGRVGENEYTEIAFDIGGYQSSFEIVSAVLVIQRAGEDEQPYPATVTIDGQYAIHTLTSTDLGTAGNGKCQLMLLGANDEVAKSRIYSTFVLCSLEDGGTPPEPWEDWMLELADLKADAEQAASDAADSALEAKGYAEAAATQATDAVDAKFGNLTATASGLAAGASPTASYDSSTNVLSLGIPKGDKGDQGSKGDKGEPGNAATITLGSVTTLSPGASAYATDTGTPSAAVFNFYIPKGDKGEQGEQGEQGEKGDVNIATFELNPNTGILSMITPDDYSSPVFQLNNGYLEVVV